MTIEVQTWKKLKAALLWLPHQFVHRFSGIGFAIPVDQIARVMKQFLEFGRILRPWLGIYCAPDQFVQKYSEVSGVFVLQTEPNSPAEQAGLRPFSTTHGSGSRRIYVGDLIHKVDGNCVSTGEELIDVVESKQPGESLVLTLFYNGAFREVTVKLAVKPKGGSAGGGSGAGPGTKIRSRY